MNTYLMALKVMDSAKITGNKKAIKAAQNVAAGIGTKTEKGLIERLYSYYGYAEIGGAR